MRKYLYREYMPYIRKRYRNRYRINTLNSMRIRDFIRFFRLVACILLFSAAISKVLNNFYASVEKVCEFKAAQLVNEYIDYGVMSASSEFKGRNFVSVSYNGDGKVTSVETDGMEINRFASVLSENIQKEISGRESETITVPLGSVTGSKLLSSFGFSIPFRIVPSGKVKVMPESSFHASGINQTVHRLKMNVYVKVRILFPITDREEEINRELIVSETVIVGDVPEVLLSKNELK
ncbi:sporulation protein YunB [Thermoclostridium stercorarium subsp. stercorarium DSM 8532]|uniref:Sporulation protein YunB n=3 Tax=Thermoclostridium stercorarium TaxID=1510 RepID=L7VJS1_THES1|nr:sporulation protein YunB [Thermoclostridium stercorarium]AGC68365.1 sporulation protein YunB [Thermoclostridium stercorarium subsp. stercorarium DSM 8532]AGI39388.1 YunB [Thermoclostridium stercorarium subsp. stercorarium DSM 8532]ANW98706.1 sporulation protein YunB [Thermoclostridium stercorarium subsp. thermolacticum DSM 2910]ANX01247.1 sporulation protein YunB [Thermoclostridium stercorarium subsp. leptospartum DSM 9219]UZQ86872.1 sporulation protein YunB [Thermoclostridium stercorarium]